MMPLEEDVVRALLDLTKVLGAPTLNQLRREFNEQFPEKRLWNPRFKQEITRLEGEGKLITRNRGQYIDVAVPENEWLLGQKGPEGPTHATIERVIRENPGTTIKELSKLVRIKKEAVHYQIRNLMIKGRIASLRLEGVGFRFYHLQSEELREEMAKYVLRTMSKHPGITGGAVLTDLREQFGSAINEEYFGQLIEKMNDWFSSLGE